MIVSRREALLGLGALLATGVSACKRNDAGEPGVVRLGYLANVTHSPVIAGVASGRIAKAIAPLTLETRVFRAGPSVVEALLSGRPVITSNVCRTRPHTTSAWRSTTTRSRATR